MNAGIDPRPIVLSTGLKLFDVKKRLKDVFLAEAKQKIFEPSLRNIIMVLIV